MLVTEKKPYGVLKAQLEPGKSITIITCNACARICETGGEAGARELEKRLKADGFEVKNIFVVPVMCYMANLRGLIPEGDIIIVLACDAGVFTVTKMFPEKKVVAGLDSVGIAARDERGDIFIVRKFE